MFKKDAAFLSSTVAVTVDGKPLELPAGVSVAAALLSVGLLPGHGDSVPHCFMGACCACLVEIDGSYRQACTTAIRAGMVINRLHEQEADTP